MHHNRICGQCFAPALFSLALLSSSVAFAQQNSFSQTNLVSDIPGLAARTDPNLVNPWGLVAGPTTAWWVSDAGTGKATLYNGSGVPQALVVTVPVPGGGQSSPTGQVFNGGSAFNGDRFIFSTEDGSIAGWRGALGTNAETLFDRTGAGAIYKGLAIGSTGGSTYLYASDFHNGAIDVFGPSGLTSLTGNFMDPTLPSGYAPFNIQAFGSTLYVTYAKQDADAEDDVPGLGNGFVDTFDLNGNFIKRLISGGPLDSPWGLAFAPAGFGPFGGDLLVGNFGNGWINVFDPNTGMYIDSLRDNLGNPLVIHGLWGLAFGNGAAAGPTDTLYFTAGIGFEEHGLFGSITPVPEPSTGVMAGAFVALVGLVWIRRRRAAAR